MQDNDCIIPDVPVGLLPSGAMKKGLVSFLFFVGMSFSVFAQEDYTWWNTIHHWDGVTPWNQYLTVSPAFFGPNALPVPDIRSGVPDSLYRFEIMTGVHASPGDHTVDGSLTVVAPFCDGKITLEAFVVPLEFYCMDTLTRDVRAVRDQDGRGRAGGDIYFSTNIALLKDHPVYPDIALEIALRTASGTQLGAARYTDAPGYYMDLSFGKSYSINEAYKLRGYVMSGFYSYQTYDLQQLQNDCFLYGAGVDVSSTHFRWSNQLGGYVGYRHDGDAPLVFRSLFRFECKLIDWLLDFQVGGHDYAYRSVHAGLSWKLRP